MSRTRNLETALEHLSAEDIEWLYHDWPIWARPDQLPPNDCDLPQPWRTWLILGGRGAGKTRAGAEWVRAMALGCPPARPPVGRIALIGETLGDARAVMVEGVSGLGGIHRDDERPNYEPSKRQLTWPNGAIAQLFSADDPESLRGPQFGAAWCDELCKWRYGEATWDMLQFALRLGDDPRQIITTTPRTSPLLKRIMALPTTVTTRASTFDNAHNLAAPFLTAVEGRYGGTRLGRQELNAEIIEDREDTLWPRAVIERHRIGAPPELTRIVVAVDPPVTSGARADACGIVVAGLGVDGRAYVLADRTTEGRQPLAWARRVVESYHGYEADRVVAEVNQGGELVTTLLGQIDASVPVKRVRATRGKWVRAEPVAAQYAQGRVSHVGALPELEDQLVDFGADGHSGGRSPDRLDALVWALTELLVECQGRPRVRSLA